MASCAMVARRLPGHEKNYFILLTNTIQPGDNKDMKSLAEMIKAHDESFAKMAKSHENLLCALGQLVDDIIDKDLGLSVDYNLVKNAVSTLIEEKWMDNHRQGKWDHVVAGLTNTSVEEIKKLREKEYPHLINNVWKVNRKCDDDEPPEKDSPA